jgi:hypothetical protein
MINRISIQAVVIAFVAEIVADLVLSSLVIAAFARGSLTESSSGEELRATTEAIANSTQFLLTWFVVGTGTTFGGGYLAARLAKTFPYYNGLAIGILGIALSVFFWGDGPVWFNLLGLLTTLPASIYGAHFAKLHMSETQ